MIESLDYMYLNIMWQLALLIQTNKNRNKININKVKLYSTILKFLYLGQDN